jgi:hypothetical protein
MHHASKKGFYKLGILTNFYFYINLKIKQSPKILLVSVHQIQ